MLLGESIVRSLAAFRKSIYYPLCQVAFLFLKSDSQWNGGAGSNPNSVFISRGTSSNRNVWIEQGESTTFISIGEDSPHTGYHLRRDCPICKDVL